MTAAPTLSTVHIVAALPAWMLADGEYGELAVGRTAEFGFALEPDEVELRSAPAEVAQDSSLVPTTTVSGPALVSSADAPATVDAGAVKPIVVHEGLRDGHDVVVRGRLVVEPYLWASNGVLWPLVPEGVRLWSVDRIRRAGATVSDLEVVPGPSEVDHDAVYLLDLSRP